MKKLIIAGLAALSMGLATAPSVQAAGEIGIVDTQKILTESDLVKVLKQAEQEVVAAEKKIYNQRNQKLKELENARKTMTQEQFVQLRQKYEREILEQVKKEEEKLKKRKGEIQKLKQKLEADVEKAVNQIAKQKKFAIVINKNLVLYGGQDITQEVIAALKK